MCGVIACLIPASKGQIQYCVEAINNVQTSLAKLSARGPDHKGLIVAQDNIALIGHTRLSIICVDPSANQPLQHDDRYYLSFNGEIYNYKELAVHDLGYQAKNVPKSDTQVLFELLIRFGLGYTLEKIRGPFAFFFTDRVEKVSFIARDRFGEKPIYYSAADNHFAACSDPSAMLSFSAIATRLDYNALADFLHFGFIPKTESPYKNIKKLLPGNYVTITEGKSGFSVGKPKVYSRPKFFQIKKPVRALDQFEESITRAVQMTLVSDVPVGIAMSSGIDSTLVAVIAAKLSKNTLTAYTILGENGTSDEARHASMVSEHIGINHQVVKVTDDFVLESFQNSQNWMPDLNADPSAIPLQALCASANRDGIRVLLSGDGGDEMQYGYNRHIYFYYRQKYRLATSILSSMLSIIPNAILFNILRQLGYTNPENLIKKIKDLNIDQSESFKLYKNFLSQGRLKNINSFISNLSENYQSNIENQHLTKAPVFLPLNDIGIYLPDQVLQKSDRSSMSKSVEIRSPFLNDELYALSTSFPASMHVAHFKGKMLSRTLLSKYLPNNLIDRPKQGFGAPIEYWMRGCLKGELEQLLSDKDLHMKIGNSSGDLNMIWRDFLSGKNDNADLIWRLANLLKWIKELG